METEILTHNGNTWVIHQASARRIEVHLLEGAVGEFPSIDEIEILVGCELMCAGLACSETVMTFFVL